jgi:uncharacterized membrane protein
MTSSMRRKITRFVLAIILLLGGLGLASSISLTVSHYRILSGRQLQGSLCRVSEVVDCDEVAASTFSDMAGGPWSAVGFART